MAKTILVADDKRHIVRLVQVNLARHGYAVVTAFNGVEALEKVATERPDLVILDTGLHDIDGFEVLRKLKTNPETRAVPTILLIPNGQDASVFRAWQSGTDCILGTPFNPIELVGLVHRLLAFTGGDGPGPAAGAMFGNLWTDVA